MGVPSVAASPMQASAFAGWGTSPASSGLRTSGSLKRIGGLGTSAPRPKQVTTATLCPVSDTTMAFEDLLRRTRGLSTSSRRRSVASSPSASPPEQPLSPGSSNVPLSPSSSLIVGFDIGPSAKTVTVSGFPGAPAPLAQPPPRPARAKGLLSKALDVPPSVLELTSMPSFSTDPALFFPDVDLRPLKHAQRKHPVFTSEMVATAYMVASRCYSGKVRKNGEPLLQHCLDTALTVADLGLDSVTVAAALLHESLHDGDRFLSQIEEFMPRSVVALVERVQTITEVSQLYRNHKDKLGDEGLRRMMIAMEDVGAVLIKLADRVHNMRSVAALPLDRQEALARETLEVYSVVANRLGVWYLKAELEDSAFAVLHPAEFAKLRDQVRERQDPVALEQTINTIKADLDRQGVSYEDISGRQKNLYGIWKKMVKDNKTLDEVHDVVALRVVVASKHDCYLALRQVQLAYRSVPNRAKDYIKGERKNNGYQSLHHTVYGANGRPVEVQIRTHKMHYIAEYGFAAHWKYKEQLDSEDDWLDKEVQYKKWLTQYKLGVHDKKIRPSGSPPTDSSLKGLGFQYVNGALPEDDVKVDEFLKLDRFRLQQPLAPAASILVQTQDSIETRSMPAGMTAAELAAQLGIPQLQGYAMLLNGRLPAASAVLHSGDYVQVVLESVALSRSPPRDVPVAVVVPPKQAVIPVVAPSQAASAPQSMQWQRLARTALPHPPKRPEEQPHELDIFMPGRVHPVTMPLGQGGGLGLPPHCTPPLPIAAQ